MSKLFLHKAGHDPRAASLVALHQVIYQSKDSQAALDEALSSPGMMPTDKRLCTELLYGTLRNYLRLEWAVYKRLPKPEKLPAEMRLTLIQALHEMAHLRIPHRASVDWAVGHIRNRFSPGLSKVANGVLRSLQKTLKDFKNFSFYVESFNEPDNSLTALALWYSVPVWIVKLWLNSYGEEKTKEYLEALSKPALSGLRFNMRVDGWEENLVSLAGLALDITTDSSGKNERRPDRVHPAGLAFDGSLPWEERQLVKNGLASRQSPASYQALQKLTPGHWKQPVWDVCAGRGNKTLALLEQSLVVAVASDPSLHRLKNLEPELARLKIIANELQIIPGPAVDVANQLLAKNRTFGSILIDAPCTGLGTINRRPEIRLRRTPDDMRALVKIQAGILDAACKCLKPAGQIAYVTCTLNPAENEDQVAAFITRTPGASLVQSWQTPADSPLKEFFFSALIQLP